MQDILLAHILVRKTRKNHLYVTFARKTLSFMHILKISRIYDPFMHKTTISSILTNTADMSHLQAQPYVTLTFYRQISKIVKIATFHVLISKIVKTAPPF